jgi:hypothetical protein
MLERAETDLHLRHDVPRRLRAFLEFLFAKHLDHWRPGAAPSVLFECLADGCSPVHRVVGDVLVRRPFGPGVKLDEAVARQRLVEHPERLEDRDAATKALRFFPGGHRDLAAGCAIEPRALLS